MFGNKRIRQLEEALAKQNRDLQIFKKITDFRTKSDYRLKTFIKEFTGTKVGEISEIFKEVMAFNNFKLVAEQGTFFNYTHGYYFHKRDKEVFIPMSTQITALESKLIECLADLDELVNPKPIAVTNITINGAIDPCTTKKQAEKIAKDYLNKNLKSAKKGKAKKCNSK